MTWLRLAPLTPALSPQAGRGRLFEPSPPSGGEGWVRGLAKRVRCGLAVLLTWSTPAFAADLNIGFLGTLSGAQANMAQDQLDGFQLAVKHLGGRLGGVEFALTVLNDRHDPAAAMQAVQHLLQSERVQVLLLSTDPRIGAAVVPAATGGRTFVLNLNAPAPALAGKECSPYLFSLSGLAETMHDLAGQYLQAQGYRNLAVVGPDTAGERDAVAALRRSFKGQVTEIASRRGDMDYSKELNRLRKLAPDGVYLLYTGGMAVDFLLQSAASGVKKEMPLFGPPTTLDQSLLAAVGQASLDAFSIGPWSEDLDAPANRRLMSDFESEYGRSASFFAAEGYDAAMLLDAAIRAADKKINDDDALRGALRRVDFPSTRGSFHFDTNQFPVQTYFVRQVVQDAREHMVNELRGLLAKDVRDGHAGECPMRWTAEPPPKG